jgi:SAM-dependent methyltransferase
VDDATISHLLDLNRRFYQSFANQFAITRGRIQPGIKQILNTLGGSARFLDLGCGNGQLLRELAWGGFRGQYVGVDSSAELLTHARNNAPAGVNATLIHADLASRDWDKSLPEPQFEIILAFASLHHLPGARLRRQVLHKVRTHIDPVGCFIHSEWQFLNSPRLRKRIQPWEKAGLSKADVDPGDYLLDWRRGGYGLRYVHLFTEEELESLAEQTGFVVTKTFYSDGETGNLGLYQVWKPV